MVFHLVQAETAERSFEMSWARIYEEFHKRNTGDGVVFAVTSSNRLVELFFYGRVLVKVRSRQMPADQLSEVLRIGDFGKINYTALAVKPEHIDPCIIRNYLPATAQHVFAVDHTTPFERIRFVRLVVHLKQLGTTEGVLAGSTLSEQMVKHSEGFSFRKVDIQKRLDSALDVLGFMVPSLSRESIPDSNDEVLDWIFRRPLTQDVRMETLILHYLLWGVAFAVVHPAQISGKKIEGKPGHAHVIIPSNISVGHFEAMHLYRGLDFVGQLSASRLVEKKAEMLSGEARLASSWSAHAAGNSSGDIEIRLTRKDLSSLGLSVGDGINVIFFRATP